MTSQPQTIPPTLSPIQDTADLPKDPKGQQTLEDIAGGTSLRNSMANKPKDLDGSNKTYSEWKRQIQIFVFANKSAFKTDVDRVIIALSYMTSGKAARFAQAAFDNMLETPEAWIESWP